MRSATMARLGVVWSAAIWLVVGGVWPQGSARADYVWRYTGRANDNWSTVSNWFADEAQTTPKGAAPGAVVTELVLFPGGTGSWGTSIMDDMSRELQGGFRIDRFRSSGTLNLGGNTLSLTGGVISIGGGRSVINFTNGTMVFGSPSTAVSAHFYNSNFMPTGNDTAVSTTYTASTTVWFRNVTDLTVGVATLNRTVTTSTLDLSAATIVGNAVALGGDLIVGRYAGGTSPSIVGSGVLKLPAALSNVTIAGSLIVGENLRSSTSTNADDSATGVLDLGGGDELALTTRNLLVGRGDKATGSVVNAPTTLDLTVGSLALRGVILVGYNDRTQGTNVGDNPTSGSLTSAGGTFHAYLTEMRIGQNTQPGAGGAATGMLDMSAAKLGVLDVTGPVVVGSGLNGAGTLRLRGDTGSAVGLASATSLTVGSTSAGSSGLLELDLVRFAVSGAVAINGSSGSNLGQVVVSVDGLSSGLDLGPASSLSVGSNGRIDLTFVDPLEVPENFANNVYWGLRWSGDHVAALQSLFTSGLLSWDDSAVTRGDVGIFAQGGFTFVGLIIPEPTSAAAVTLWIVTAVLFRRRGSGT